ncbi:MAG TPA: hypothetical protein VF135_13985, partial [Terriglobales bacterium]
LVLHINRRLPEVERVSHNFHQSADSIQRLGSRPSPTRERMRRGLGFGNPRVITLFCRADPVPAPEDRIRNRDLREHAAALLGTGTEATHQIR